MELRFTFCLLVVALTACQAQVPVKDFMSALLHLAVEHPEEARLMEAKHAFITDFQARSGGAELEMEDMVYFKVFPKFLASVPPDSVVQFDDFTCFHQIKLSTEMISETEIELTIEHREAESFLCHRSFVISTGAHTKVMELWGNGKKSYRLTSDGSPEQDWDLFERGPRVFMHLVTPEDLLYNLGATFALFEPEFTENVGEMFADMNREFMRAYIGIDMKPRENHEVLQIPEELIQDGDTFDLIRLNGLGPMIAWAMGAATSHTVVAMRRNGTLYLCESTTVNGDWPTNGIQCNPYADWVELGTHADYNVVWAPIDYQGGARTLDLNKAWQFVDTVLGVDYGYEVVLSGWLDTIYDNLPCPKDRVVGDMCLEPEHFEMLFSYIQRVSFAAARVFVPMIQQRAGVPFNSTLLQAYHALAQRGISPIEAFSIPEQDDWLYETTRYGEPVLSKSMVCNDFVCNVLKAGGLFDGVEINCGDSSVNDMYKLKMYKDPELRPEFCKTQDPENPTCQLMGKYTLRLDNSPGIPPRYNYVPLSDHMFENCPSLAPDYLAPMDC